MRRPEIRSRDRRPALCRVKGKSEVGSNGVKTVVAATAADARTGMCTGRTDVDVAQHRAVLRQFRYRTEATELRRDRRPFAIPALEHVRQLGLDVVRRHYAYGDDVEAKLPDMLEGGYCEGTAIASQLG